MSRYRFIKAFEHKTVLPIDLNQVVQWLLDAGIQDEINFVPVESWNRKVPSGASSSATGVPRVVGT